VTPNNDDLYAALACANALEQKYRKGNGVTVELQAANALRLLCDAVGALRDEIAVVAAAEREACAKVIDDMADYLEKEMEPDGLVAWVRQHAAEIRDRGQAFGIRGGLAHDTQSGVKK